MIVKIKIKGDESRKEEIKGLFGEETFKRILSSSRYYSNDIEIYLDELSLEELGILETYLQKNKFRSSLFKLRNYRDIITSNDVKITDLQNLTFAMIKAVGETEHKLIFKMSDEAVNAYLVNRIDFYPATGKGDSFQEAYVRMRICANTTNGFHYSNVVFYVDSLGKTLNEILADKGIKIETTELFEEYSESTEKFLREKKNFNKQYRALDNARNKVVGYFDKSERIFGNFINDEKINDKDYLIKKQCEQKEWSEEIYEVPFHHYLYLYSLDLYEDFFIHISMIEDYVYDDTLRDKLILPETQKDLLDILTNDIDILCNDIVKGKSTGTTILCKGVPGTGKTLTAEVYSEITHRPLYKVNSGLLGTTPVDVEETLSETLKRAERWNAVMLLDEADTYISKRGNDIKQNAIVASFLRTLEYFHGLLFMTTNRVDDVDDAIESRCIARIVYEVPTAKNAKRIWRVLSDEYKIALSNEMIDSLVETFPDMTGRDIKELLRLTYRFCDAKNYELTVDRFVSCAQFRGIVAKENYTSVF